MYYATMDCLICMSHLQEQKQLKQLMYALSAHTDSLGGQGSNNSMTAATRAVDIHAKELAFVFTDIENSTEISNQDPTAFKEVWDLLLCGTACCCRALFAARQPEQDAKCGGIAYTASCSRTCTATIDCYCHHTMRCRTFSASGS